MAESNSLTAAEARRLRMRRAVNPWAQAAFFVIVFWSMFGLASICQHAWVAVALAGAIICFVLHVRATLCPRCRRPIYGPRPADDNMPYAGDPVLLTPPLPPRCLSCGVALTPLPDEPDNPTAAS